jgi:hypothetical protein
VQSAPCCWLLLRCWAAALHCCRGAAAAPHCCCLAAEQHCGVAAYSRTFVRARTVRTLSLPAVEFAALAAACSCPLMPAKPATIAELAQRCERLEGEKAALKVRLAQLRKATANVTRVVVKAPELEPEPEPKLELELAGLRHQLAEIREQRTAEAKAHAAHTLELETALRSAQETAKACAYSAQRWAD